MTPSGWLFVLAATTFLLFVGPLLPGIIEWWRKTDAAPLRVVRKEDANIRHFANSFQSQVYELLAERGIDPLEPPVNIEGIWKHDEKFRFIGAPSEILTYARSNRPTLVDHLVIAATDITVPKNTVFDKGIYVIGALRVNEASTFRALYATGSVELGERCIVMRWMHSIGPVEVAKRCRIYGRISSDTSIKLATGVRFERLNAPIVRTGNRQRTDDSAYDEWKKPWQPTETFQQLDAHTALFRTSVSIPGGQSFNQHLVSKHAVSLGQGVRVCGSIKAYDTVKLGRHCRVDGSIVCEGEIVIGAGSVVRGPIISERSVLVGNACTLGSLQAPTTVTAPKIRLRTDTTVHGTIWAAQEASVGG